MISEAEQRLLETIVDKLAERSSDRSGRDHVDLIASVGQSLCEFPEIALRDRNLPAIWTLRGLRIRLFPLGAFRRVTIGHMNGYSSLHISSNRRLYEFGPEQLHGSESDNPTTDVVMGMRVLHVEQLSYGDLLMARELLRRIYL